MKRGEWLPQRWTKDTSDEPPHLWMLNDEFPDFRCSSHLFEIESFYKYMAETLEGDVHRVPDREVGDIHPGGPRWQIILTYGTVYDPVVFTVRQ